MINKYIGQKVLITCSEWFTGPDGKSHKAVWGTLNGVNEAGKHLGFIPNRAHANWFYEIGDMVIMGCQVKYLILCPNNPGPHSDEWAMDATMIAPKEYIAKDKILLLE